MESGGREGSSHPNLPQAGKMMVINKVMLTSKYLSPPLICSCLRVKGFLFAKKTIMTSSMIKVSSTPMSKARPCPARGYCP